MGNKAGANKPNRLYTDFEPYCIWHNKEDTDILDVHLNGFKGEQLKLRIDKERILTISGERPLDDDNNKWSCSCKQIKLGERPLDNNNNEWSCFCKQIKLGERPLDDNNKWSRFCKHIKLAESVKVNDISSNFTGGILTVVMPKKPEILSTSISLASEVLRMTTAMENAGVWTLEIDKNLVVKVGVVLVFLLLGFVVYVKCLCGK